jgi:hypothetical protein
MINVAVLDSLVQLHVVLDIHVSITVITTRNVHQRLVHLPRWLALVAQRQRHMAMSLVRIQRLSFLGVAVNLVVVGQAKHQFQIQQEHVKLMVIRQSIVILNRYVLVIMRPCALINSHGVLVVISHMVLLELAF